MQVLECIKKYRLIKPGMTVGVAVSGGSDSMALLHFLYINRVNLGIELVVINVEHGIRGERSVSDSKVVASAAEELGLKLCSRAVDVPNLKRVWKLTTEQSARKARYDFFDELLGRGDCDVIATAHNKNDQVETLLMNVFRGCGAGGMLGIRYCSGGIIRPLLMTTKEQVLKYCVENNVKYVEDETNYDTGYTRNFVRHELLPKINGRFEGADDRIVCFSELITQDNEYLNTQSLQYIKDIDGGRAIDIECMDTYPIASRAIIQALGQLNLTQNVEKTHIESVIKLANQTSGAAFSLPEGFIAQREYGRITLFKGEISDGYCEKFSFGNIFLPKMKLTIELYDNNYCYEKSENTMYFKFSPDVENSVIRQICDCDEITAFGGVHKRLNKYLSDKKVPQRQRKNLAVIAVGQKVLAVIGVDISEDVRIENGDKIVKITVMADIDK